MKPFLVKEKKNHMVQNRPNPSINRSPTSSRRRRSEKRGAQCRDTDARLARHACHAPSTSLLNGDRAREDLLAKTTLPVVGAPSGDNGDDALGRLSIAIGNACSGHDGMGLGIPQEILRLAHDGLRIGAHQA